MISLPVPVPVTIACVPVTVPLMPVTIPVMVSAAPVILWAISRCRSVASAGFPLLQLSLQLVIDLMRLYPSPAQDPASVSRRYLRWPAGLDFKGHARRACLDVFHVTASSLHRLLSLGIL